MNETDCRRNELGFESGTERKRDGLVGVEGGVDRSITRSYNWGFSRKRRSVVPVRW